MIKLVILSFNSAAKIRVDQSGKFLVTEKIIRKFIKDKLEFLQSSSFDKIKLQKLENSKHNNYLHMNNIHK